MAVCRAVSHQAINRILATIHCMDAQNTFCHFGELCLPHEVRVSTTNDPESEEVIKKLATKITVMKELKKARGYCSNIL